VALHGIQDYPGYPYCRLIDVLQEMPSIVAKFDPTVGELPDLTTVYSRGQDLELPIWRMLVFAQLQAPWLDLGH